MADKKKVAGISSAEAEILATVKGVPVEAVATVTTVDGKEEKKERRAVYFLGLPEELDDMITSMSADQNISRPAAFQQIFGFDVKAYDRKTCLANNVKYQLAQIESLKAKVEAGKVELEKLKA
jgi:hypothetical protein